MDRKNEKNLPTQAKGNPVYEQTREDMPLWCCGRNCGRNSRIVVFILSIIGIAMSIWLCKSPDYFKFYALRNDTFYDEDKKQPDPFQFATEAEVGLFNYKIISVWEYDWVSYRERQLFEKMLEKELRRLEQPITDPPTKNPTMTPTQSPTKAPSVSPSIAPSSSPSGSPSMFPSGSPSMKPSLNPSESPSARPSLAPSTKPTVTPTSGPTSSQAPSECRPDLYPGIALPCDKSEMPTLSPTARPTTLDPNIYVRESTYPLNTVKSYENGMKQFDKIFHNAQLGSILGPVFAGLAFITGLAEYFCCIFKCSWLPTAIFLYLAFTFQMFTIFIFLSDDFCNYSHDCRLGGAGYGTIIATICYFICQMLICCTPRPDPMCNLLKPAPKRVKKKRGGEDGFDDGEYYDDDEYYDEFSGHDDYYDDEYGSSQFGSSYQDDPYGDDQQGYGDESTFREGATYDDGQTFDDDAQTFGAESSFGADSRFGYDDANGID